MSRHTHDTELDAAQVLLRLDGRFTELAEILNGQSVNKVLWCGTAVLDSTGVFTQNFRVPFGSVSVANFAASTVTIVNAPPQNPGSPPTSGRGVLLCAASGDGTFRLAGTVLTIYGPAGAQVVLEVLADAQPVHL